MDLIGQARTFAIAAHSAVGQRRKYTGDPYWYHPLRVADIIVQYQSSTTQMVAAAWLHDVVEDTDIPLDLVEHQFGSVVGRYVQELTNVPANTGNRRERFLLNKERLRTASPEAQTIKLADIIDNVGSIAKYDPKFAKIYLAEKAEVVDVLTGGNLLLQYAAREELSKGFRLIQDH